MQSITSKEALQNTL